MGESLGCVDRAAAIAIVKAALRWFVRYDTETIIEERHLTFAANAIMSLPGTCTNETLITRAEADRDRLRAALADIQDIAETVLEDRHE